jgi:hypothetical protein
MLQEPLPCGEKPEPIARAFVVSTSDLTLSRYRHYITKTVLPQGNSGHSEDTGHRSNLVWHATPEQNWELACRAV